MIAGKHHLSKLCAAAWLSIAAPGRAQQAAPPPAAPSPAPAVPESAPPPVAAPAAPAPVPVPATVPAAPEVTKPEVPKPRLSALTSEPVWKNLALLSGVLRKEEFESVLSKVYSNGSTETPPWAVTSDALVVEGDPEVPQVKIAFRQGSEEEAKPTKYWRRPSELPPLKPGEPPLKGLHIALDPGHIGGGYAVMEERSFSGAPGETIMEGHLTLEVANLLKPKLEALGARVSLVRNNEAPVTTAKPTDFLEQAKQILREAGVETPKDRYDGITGLAKFATLQYQEEKLFYRISEIRARGQRVNAEIKPDLVLCLHFNAEEWGDPSRPGFSPNNHFHLLINGCYLPSELHLDDVRFDLIERIFSRIHEEEVALADPVAAAVAKETGLPPYTYPNQNARRVSSSPYVWARNLLANRIYQCPVLYFEPYVMNNEKTFHRLLLGAFIGRTLMGSELVTSPLEDYARGIASGLEQYYSKARAR